MFKKKQKHITQNIKRQHDAKRMLATMCISLNKAYIYDPMLTSMTEVVVYGDSKQKVNLCTVPVGSLFEYTVGGKLWRDSHQIMDGTVKINNFICVASYEGHVILNSGSHIISTLDLTKEFEEVMRSGCVYRTKELTKEVLVELIRQHFYEDTVENAIAETCINNNKEPMILPRNSEIIVNRGSRKEKRMSYHTLDPNAFTPTANIDVILPPELNVYNIGIVDNVLVDRAGIAIETRIVMDFDEIDRGLPTGHVLSTIDFEKEYYKKMRDRYAR